MKLQNIIQINISSYREFTSQSLIEIYGIIDSKIQGWLDREAVLKNEGNKLAVIDIEMDSMDIESESIEAFASRFNTVSLMGTHGLPALDSLRVKLEQLYGRGNVLFYHKLLVE